MSITETIFETLAHAAPIARRADKALYPVTKYGDANAGREAGANVALNDGINCAAPAPRIGGAA